MVVNVEGFVLKDGSDSYHYQKRQQKQRIEAHHEGCWRQWLRRSGCPENEGVLCFQELWPRQSNRSLILPGFLHRMPAPRLLRELWRQKILQVIDFCSRFSSRVTTYYLTKGFKGTSQLANEASLLSLQSSSLSQRLRLYVILIYTSTLKDSAFITMTETNMQASSSSSSICPSTGGPVAQDEAFLSLPLSTPFPLPSLLLLSRSIITLSWDFVLGRRATTCSSSS